MRWRIQLPSEAERRSSEGIPVWKALGLSPAYECTEGASPWEDSWSQEQKRWCCQWTSYDRENWPENQQAFCSNESYFRQA